MMLKTSITAPHLKHIDSLQKLQVLLFLQQNPHFKGTSQDLAQCLYWADHKILQKILAELREVGLMDFLEGVYQLGCTPEIKSFINNLAMVYDDPLDRQMILDLLRQRATPALAVYH